MTLDDFSGAEAAPGYQYELARGVVEVTNIPGFLHHIVVRRLNTAITLYDHVHPGVIFSVGGGAEAKLEMWGRETERHPDISIYLGPPPEPKDQPWDRWIPETVIEVVSPSSVERDYKQKPFDYLAAGVREYWIIDPDKRCELFNARRSDIWTKKRIGIRGTWRTTLLPGFVLEMAEILAKLPR